MKWFNEVKGFGFVVPDEGGEKLFLPRSVLEQVGPRDLPDGTRVRVRTSKGRESLQISTLTLA